MRLRYTQQSLKICLLPGDSRRETEPALSRISIFPIHSLCGGSADCRTGCAKTVGRKTISGAAVAVDRAISRGADAGSGGCARAAGSFLFWKRGRRRLEDE